MRGDGAAVGGAVRQHLAYSLRRRQVRGATRDRPENGPLIFCDFCNKGYHLECHEPTLDAAPEGDWICFNCKLERDSMCAVCGMQDDVNATLVLCETADCPQFGACHVECMTLDKRPPVALDESDNDSSDDETGDDDGSDKESASKESASKGKKKRKKKAKKEEDKDDDEEQEEGEEDKDKEKEKESGKGKGKARAARGEEGGGEEGGGCQGGGKEGGSSHVGRDGSRRKGGRRLEECEGRRKRGGDEQGPLRPQLQWRPGDPKRTWQLSNFHWYRRLQRGTREEAKAAAAKLAAESAEDEGQQQKEMERQERQERRAAAHQVAAVERAAAAGLQAQVTWRRLTPCAPS